MDQTPIPNPTDPTPLTQSILDHLKKGTDLLCPVMQEIYPQDNVKFLTMALNTLVEIGYTITPPEEG